MNAYIVTYDLRNQRNYPAVYAALKRYHDVIPLLESSWGITSSCDAMTILNDLRNHIDRDDRLFIVRASSNWSSLQLDAGAIAWFRRNVAA